MSEAAGDLDRCEIAIVGAGPQALAAALHLVDAGVSPTGIRAVDPTGRWLARWDHQMARHEIEHLRSPGVHHPGTDAHALGAWARGRGDDALRGRYQLPSTSAFSAYCSTLVERADLDGSLLTAAVEAIRAAAGGRPLVALEDGRRLEADRVVVALNGATAVLPDWAAGHAGHAGAEELLHSDEVTLGDVEVEGRHVLVVGGGLTAAQLVHGAVRRGATATLVTRRPLQVQSFDADPGWLGPKLMAGFEKEPDPAVRRRRLAEVRKGSVPQADAQRLGGLVGRGALTLEAGHQVVEATRSATGWEAHLDDGRVVHADRIWCATGHRHDVLAQPELADLHATHPIQVCDGLPVLDDDLSWSGLPVHLMGAYAGLVLGPTARNLSGARRAAERIASAHRPGHVLRAF